MLKHPLVNLNERQRIIVRVAYIGMLLLMMVASIGFVTVVKSIELAVDEIQTPTREPFPISVNPTTETIEENPEVEIFFDDVIAQGPRQPHRRSWFDRLFASLAEYDWYQGLALSSSRVLVIFAGERKEEVTNNFGDILRWTDAERTLFQLLVEGAHPTLSEGMFLPSKYVVTSDAGPEVVARQVIDKFDRQIVARYPSEVDAVVPFNDALIIASLLEREAYDFTDMREISGVIWNRLFIDMKLQLDATLQYARGSEPTGPWWPKPVPNDKFIDSPFNTYQNAGLPPTPIANPSVEAVLAALNPISTDCLFYFHSNGRDFYCSATYEEHVGKLRELYGRGR